MASINAFTGVGNGVWAVDMSRTLHAAEAAAAAAAHPAFWAYVAGAAAAIPPQRKRRTTTATGQSVNRGAT